MEQSVPTELVQRRLLALRDVVIRRAAGLTANLEAIVDAARDVATDDEHDPEGHTIAWERQQVAALADDAHAAHAEIDAAERRLAAGTYGICIDCDRPIAAERLEVLPATPVCVACADDVGRTQPR